MLRIMKTRTCRGCSISNSTKSPIYRRRSKGSAPTPITSSSMWKIISSRTITIHPSSTSSRLSTTMLISSGRQRIPALKMTSTSPRTSSSAMHHRTPPTRKLRKLRCFISSLSRSPFRPKKPPFTYTELIEYALEDKGELTVSGIYQWIS